MNTETEAVMDSRIADPANTRELSPWQGFYWSVKRELWESRSIYLSPLGAAVLFLCGFLVSAAHLPRQMRALAPLTALQQRHGIEQPYELAAALIMGLALLVSVFYSIDTLQAERRDRSILFWKSLPVSDLTTVLAKASIPMLVIPIVAFVITVVTQLIMAGISTVVLWAGGMNAGAIWAQEPFARISLLLFYHLLTVHGLYWAPFYGWLLLVSAWTPRASFVWAASWAVVPPFAICFVEKVAFNTSYFAHILLRRFNGSGAGEAMTMPGTMPMNAMTQVTPLRFLASPGLWIGLAIFAVFIAGAVYFRRQRGPA